MFNSYDANNSTSIKFNSVSGTLVKSHPKSFFIHRSTKAYIFDDNNPCLTVSYGSVVTPIVVLQTMILGENSLLCEVIKKEDYENALNGTVTP